MDNLITVATFDIPVKAEAHKLFLEAEGIRAFLMDDNLVGMDWFLSNAVGGVKLQVAAEDAERAIHVLDKFRASNNPEPETLSREDITFACDNCGRNITFPANRCGHVETCPHCGGFVDVPDNFEEPAVAESEKTSSPATPGKTAVEHSGRLDPDSSKKIYLWLEILAVLCLAYVPYMYSALVSFIMGRQADSSFVSHELYLLVAAIQISMPMLLIMALSKDSWSKFGIVRPLWIADALGGMAIFFMVIVARYFVIALLPSSLWESSTAFIIAKDKPSGIFEHFLIVFALVIGGFSEELVMRGYLIPRLERLLRSSWAAILITSVLFASYHLYQGIPSTIIIAGYGLVYGVSFCYFRRLWPLCVAHILHNLLIYL